MRREKEKQIALDEWTSGHQAHTSSHLSSLPLMPYAHSWKSVSVASLEHWRKVSKWQRVLERFHLFILVLLLTTPLPFICLEL
jgi:hypothetical protein